MLIENIFILAHNKNYSGTTSGSAITSVDKIGLLDEDNRMLSSYKSKSNQYWLINPYNSNSKYQRYFYYSQTSDYGLTSLTAMSVVPVLNLLPGVSLTGSGTLLDPYVIVS